MRDACHAVVVVWVLAVTIATAVVLPGTHEPAAGRPPPSPAAVALEPNPSVAIDPSSWWMESGANSTFVATWTGMPAGCSLEPVWFRWAIGPGGSQGALEGTNGSRTQFLASAAGTGSSTIVVRAAASMDCQGNVTASFSRATAVVTVAVPLALSEVAFATNPIAIGMSTDLEGTLVGGNPPYGLRIDWGDGSVSYENVSGPGPFSEPHTFADSGTFEAVVLATDAAGRSDLGEPEEPLTVSGGFAAAIVPSTLVAEVGVPASFEVRTANAPASFSWLFVCENAEPADPTEATGLDYGCAFDSAGVDPVTFEGVGASSPFPVATATLEEVVVPPPSLGFPSAPTTGEVGGTVYAPVQISGGVPPFTLNWSLVGTGRSGTESVPSDGVDYLPLTSGTAGTLALSVTVLDALGEAGAPAEEGVVFLPPLDMSAAAVARVVAGAIALNVSASVVEGVPPFDWAVVPDAPAANGSLDAGNLTAPGAFAWNATYRTEGALNVTVAVVDATGNSAVVNLTVVLALRLSVVADVDPVGPGLVVLGVTIAGGVAPFNYLWNDSAGEGWNGSAAGSGTFLLRARTAANGGCEFAVRVTDALGSSASLQLHADLPAPAEGPGLGSGVGLSVVVAGLLAAGASSVLLLRRHRGSAPPTPPDPVTVLREVIEPSDGVDRALVELLAEERGVPLEVVRSTLERLKATGAVRAGRGSDGEEVLAWSEPLPH